MEKIEKLDKKLDAILALKDDKEVKPWLYPNEVLFIESTENRDMFLTTYRIRNSYEELLNKLELNEKVTDEKDLILIQRIFDMSFYQPKKLNLSEMKEGKDPVVKILSAYKDDRLKGNKNRKFEITLLLDDRKKYQINLNSIILKFLHVRETFDKLLKSEM